MMDNKNNESWSDYASLDSRFFDFVSQHANDDVFKLMLSQRNKDLGFPLDFACVQIECRAKTAKKLSSFNSLPCFLYPSVLAAEQSTNQSVAAYHASLVGKGRKIIDITAGLGIDAFSMAKNGNELTAIELDRERAAALEYNRKLLELNNLQVICGDSIEWLRSRLDKAATPPPHYDYLFVDPARRSDDNRRTYFFADCLPDIVTNWEPIARAARTVMVKASPIVDIKQVLRELPDVTQIHLVCVKGECKEVLIISSAMKEAGGSSEPEITAVDLGHSDNETPSYISRWSCRYSELGAEAPLAETEDIKAGNYIYDPNAAIHKLNCGGLLCRDFEGLRKLSANTDLYVSEKLHKDFPGRIFMIEEVPEKRKLRSLKDQRRDIISRNHPLSADQLRKKLGVYPGDDTNYLIAAAVGANPRNMFIEAIRVRH